MKTIQLFLFSSLCMLLAQSGIAQSKTETFKVAGECGMCKNKIEASAKKAGATYAVWNVETKELTVTYNNTSSKAAKIQQGIAKAGYDTPNYKATENAYNGLHECCKYDRVDSSSNCCASEKCIKSACMKNGKCVADAGCCKDSGCSEKECCTKH